MEWQSVLEHPVHEQNRMLRYQVEITGLVYAQWYVYWAFGQPKQVLQSVRLSPRSGRLAEASRVG